MSRTELQPEPARNRLLRRADWRFLLHMPSPGRSVCLSRGLLARAVAKISAEVVPAEGCAPGSCDLAVAVNPGAASLRALRAALRPGGACYTEWYLPFSGGAAQIRRGLETAGFEEVACYWAWPWPARRPAQLWLPLEAPGALHYFLASRPQPRGRLRRAGRSLARLLWGVGQRAGLTFPVYALARRPVSRHDRPSLPASAAPPPGEMSAYAGTGGGLAATIRAGWGRWGLGPTPGRLAVALLTGGERSINKVVGLVFADGEALPRLAVKMARTPEAAPGMRHEAAALRAVHALRPGGVPGVPQALFVEERDGSVMVGETMLAGRPLWMTLGRDNYRRLALQATDWLADLAGRPPLQDRAEWWPRLAEPALADFGAAFGAVVDPEMLRETRAALATLGALPRVCEQRDFSPWNVLAAPSGQLVVLDWESAEIDGLPAMDLVYFLTYLSFFLDGSLERGTYREAYRAMLCPTTSTGAVFHECMEHYAMRIGRPVADLHALRPLVWLIHARSEYRQLAGDHGGWPSHGALRRSVFVGLWEEELRGLAGSRAFSGANQERS